MQLHLPLGEPFSVRLPFKDALRFFQENYWNYLPKSKTTQCAFRRIEAFMDSMGIRYVDEVSKSIVEALRRHLAGLGLKQNTINTYHVIITRFYSKLYEWRRENGFNGLDFSKFILPEQNPGSLVPKVDERQFANTMSHPKRDILRLIHVAIELKDLDLAEIIQMLYWTELRQGDLHRITDRNVDLPHGLLCGVQHKTITTRYPSGVPYRVVVTPKMGAILRRRLSSTKTGEILFPKRNLLKRWARLRREANLPHIKMKELRHSAATLLLDNGTDTRTVSETLGHTTERNLPAYARRNYAHHLKARTKLEDEESEILEMV